MLMIWLGLGIKKHLVRVRLGFGSNSGLYCSVVSFQCPTLTLFSEDLLSVILSKTTNIALKQGKRKNRFMIVFRLEVTNFVDIYTTAVVLKYTFNMLRQNCANDLVRFRHKIDLLKDNFLP